MARRVHVNDDVLYQSPQVLSHSRYEIRPFLKSQKRLRATRERSSTSVTLDSTRKVLAPGARIVMLGQCRAGVLLARINQWLGDFFEHENGLSFPNGRNGQYRRARRLKNGRNNLTSSLGNLARTGAATCCSANRWTSPAGTSFAKPFRHSWEFRMPCATSPDHRNFEAQQRPASLYSRSPGYKPRRAGPCSEHYCQHGFSPVSDLERLAKSLACRSPFSSLKRNRNRGRTPFSAIRRYRR